MTQSSSPLNPAEAYERFIAQNLFLPWSADLLKRAAPDKGSRVLDLACGSGIVARQVAPMLGRAGTLVGLDISQPMLDVAGSLMSEDGPSVEWRQGSGTEMPFEDGSFDLVVCQQGLQFFPDHQTGMNEIFRVLAPAGRVGLSVWRGLEHQPVMRAMDGAASKHIGPGAFGPPFSLGDASRLAELAKNSGFQDIDIQQPELSIRVKDPDSFLPMMLQGAAAVLPQFQELTPENRQAAIKKMHADLTEQLDDYLDGDELRMDMTVNVLTARR